MPPVYFTPLAEADLEQIGDYIAQDSPLRAVSYVRELITQCRKIASAPLHYRARAELAEGLRSCAYRQHVIFFAAREAGISVIRILHRAQDIQATFSEQPTNRARAALYQCAAKPLTCRIMQAHIPPRHSPRHVAGRRADEETP